MRRLAVVVVVASLSAAALGSLVLQQRKDAVAAPATRERPSASAGRVGVASRSYDPPSRAPSIDAAENLQDMEVKLHAARQGVEFGAREIELLEFARAEAAASAEAVEVIDRQIEEAQRRLAKQRKGAADLEERLEELR